MRCQVTQQSNANDKKEETDDVDADSTWVIECMERIRLATVKA